MLNLMTGKTLTRLTPLAALLAALPLTPALADNAADITAADTLPAVSVTATRLAKDADSVAPNTAVLSTQGDGAGTARNLQTLLGDEPGVDVSRDPVRRGLGSIAIRGLDGNRILLQIDGISLPSLYAGGGAAISGRDMVEIDTLSAVEVVKGPYSGLYGADAIAGVVAYRSLAVEDLLQAGDTVGGQLRAGYYGADSSNKLGASAGLRSGQFSALFSYTRRAGENTESMGTDGSASDRRTVANPLDWDSQALLAKLAWSPAAGQSLSLTHDIFRRDQTGDFLSNRSAALLSQTASDKSRRDRTSLAYDYSRSGSGLVGAHFQLYTQSGESRENGLEQLPGNIRRSNQSGFEQEGWGLNAQLTHRLDQGSLLHSVVWGAEYNTTETSRPRYRLQTNANGSSTTVVGGEQFPQKTFPDNNSKRLGLFAQDEITFASGMTLTPSLRYDHYTLTPKPDALFAAANPRGLNVAEYKDSAISPRLALSLPLATGWTGFAQLGTGFRTPNFDDAMLVFSNAAHGYEVLPNPALKSEKSRSLELGSRYRSSQLELAATYFQSRYSDFIENVLVSPRDTNGNGINLEYQARNITRMRIQGVELKALWRMTDAWHVRGALAYARGDKTSEAKPYDGVEPLNGQLALHYQGSRWQTALTLRGAESKDRLSSNTLFAAPGYGVLDLSASMELGPDATLSAGLYNLADKKYWLWSDVRGLVVSGRGSVAAVLDRYTQPGRNGAISFEYRF
ncbi:TonB-dependent hemoglobin/transferrin/lactoferrin family receptor [Chitinimonas viridis]|uniref:TonB-dependent hemoglobin/transferrin/lactoferrin family receptor n=1 Tax=Chitinimonas viridis TaxID=664880 RepID=A0ABT8B1T4_9NEIS|nr:TonB-dependent hemoglobin/transferrin/lactoferrin family receptor [Chitinimonas viridis]MDN3576227.1 TonB-dependent hemoglobin/transferrin/lactoferrin family receptor [Chitinimonas viridis]